MRCYARTLAFSARFFRPPPAPAHRRRREKVPCRALPHRHRSDQPRSQVPELLREHDHSRIAAGLPPAGANEPRRPTMFIALNRMPQTAGEVADWVAAVHAGQGHQLHRVFEWPAARVAEGDWTPCQYYDGALAALARDIDALDVMTPLAAWRWLSRAASVCGCLHEPRATATPQPTIRWCGPTRRMNAGA